MKLLIFQVLASLAPDRKMVVFTKDRGWQFMGNDLPKTRSNYTVVGDHIYMVTPEGMLSKFGAEAKSWEKVSKVPFIGLYTGPVRLVHHHPAIYIFQGRYNVYYDYQKGTWGQVCPLPDISLGAYNWQDEVIQSGEVLADDRIVITWNKVQNAIEYVSPAIYDRNTNQWVPMGVIKCGTDHFVFTHEKCTFLLNKEHTYTSTGVIYNGYRQAGNAWAAFSWTYHSNNIGALVNPLTGKDIVVTFGGVGTPTGIQKNPQGYYPCLEEDVLKLNPDNGLQMTTGEGNRKITTELLIEGASIMYVPRDLCC